MKWRTKNDSRNKPLPTHPPQPRPRTPSINPLNALNAETRRGVENLARAGSGIGQSIKTTLNIFRPKK